MPFKPYIGQCVHCGEPDKPIVVKAGYCRFCNETYRKAKAPNPKIKRTPLKASNKNRYDNARFYQNVWEYWRKNNMLYCTESREPLGEFSPSKVAHILSRGSHPALAYVYENVIPLLPEYHRQLDHGKCTELKIWPWIQEKREYLKRKYYKAKEEP